MEVKKEEPETINVSELMSGIDDGREAPPRSMDFPAIAVQKHMPISSDLASRLSLDAFSLDPRTDIPEHEQQASLQSVDQSLSRPNTSSTCESRADNLQSVLPDQASVRPSEGNALPESSSASSSFFATTSRFMKWFTANKGVVKSPNSMAGGSQQKNGLKNILTHANAPPAMSTLPSGNTIEKGPSKQLNRSNSQESESGSSSSGNDDVPDLSGPSWQKPANVEHGQPVRRYRHSFSSGNQRRVSVEDQIPASMNRPSSWELEKVVTDSGFKAVLYSTNVRTDINAYEDSNAVRAILISLVGAAFDEKSISQNPEYEQELKFALNRPVVAVPTVFVQGKYIAGIDNIMQSFKKGILGSLVLQTLPHSSKPTTTCICRGGKFLICPICKGRRRITRQGEEPVSCRHCVGTGLLKCPSCPK